MSPTLNLVWLAETLIALGQMPPFLARSQTVFLEHPQIAANVLSSTNAESASESKAIAALGIASAFADSAVTAMSFPSDKCPVTGLHGVTRQEIYCASQYFI